MLLSLQKIKERLRTHWLIAALPLLTSVSAIGAELALQVNQEGYYRYGDKSAFLFLDEPIEDVLRRSPGNGNYFSLMVVNSNWQPGEEVNEGEGSDGEYANLTIYRAGDIGAALGEVLPDAEGNPTGKYMYEWKFDNFRVVDPDPEFGPLPDPDEEYRVILWAMEREAADESIGEDAEDAEDAGWWSPLRGHHQVVYMSHPFKVHNDVMRNKYMELANAAFKYFYAHRLGQPTDAGVLAAEGFVPGELAHEAFHADPVPCYNNWCVSGTTPAGPIQKAVGGGTAWADAADFGVYPVNHAFSAWTLLNAVESNPDSFQLNAIIGAPGDAGYFYENNRYYNLLTEIEIGSQFMLNLSPGTNAAGVPFLYPHKIHNQNWDDASAWSPEIELGVRPAYVEGSTNISDPGQDYNLRSATLPSTAATLAVCRTGAHLARLMHRFGKYEQRDRWLDAAVDALNTARVNAVVLYPASYGVDEGDNPRMFPNGGGPYGDNNVSDDEFACVTELYLTHYAMGVADNSYRQQVIDSAYYAEPRQDKELLGFDADFSYVNVATTAWLSLLSADNDLNLGRIEGTIMGWAEGAENHLRSHNSSSNPTANEMTHYPHYWSASHPEDWWWGSNPASLGHGILLTHVAKILFERATTVMTDSESTVDPADNVYLTLANRAASGAMRVMDYMLGMNALEQTFITGFGDVAETATHDRMSYHYVKADPENRAFPRGWLTGGPQNDWESCFSGGELNSNGESTWERGSRFWDSASDAHGMNVHIAHGGTFWGPEIEDTNREGSNYDGVRRYNMNVTNFTEVPGNILARYMSERVSLGESTTVLHIPLENGNQLLPIPPAMVYAKAWSQTGIPTDTLRTKFEPALFGWCTKENAINYNAHLTWMALAAGTILPDIQEAHADPENWDWRNTSSTTPDTPFYIERKDEFPGGYCNRIVVTNPSQVPVNWVMEMFEPHAIYESWNINLHSLGGNRYAVDGSRASLPWCEVNDPDCAGHFQTIGSGETFGDLGYCVYTGTAAAVENFNVTTSIHSESETGYCADITVRNDGPVAVDTWEAVVNVNGTVTQAWNMNYTQNGNTVRFTPNGGAWVSHLEPQQQTHSTGFCVSY